MFWLHNWKQPAHRPQSCPQKIVFYMLFISYFCTLLIFKQKMTNNKTNSKCIILKWGKEGIMQYSYTSISSQEESCFALSCLMAFPAFVTNTVGIRNFPSESTSLLNDSNAEGNTFLPRTITPSISNNNPKAGFPLWKETCSSRIKVLLHT